MNHDNEQIGRATASFRRTNLALSAAGFSTFLLMYCAQPLLPEFTREFHVTAAVSSLAMSLTTGCLAVALLVVGALSEAWGRKPVMVTSLVLGAVLTMAAAAAPTWSAFLAIRALEGIAFAGLPALAMAYLSEEVDPLSVGLSMGLYVSGTALGGMTGRLLTAVLTDVASWRVALATIGGVGLAAALLFWTSLPPSTHFRSRSLEAGGLLRAYEVHLRDPVLVALFAEGFLFMGSFVTLYNYIGFRLLQPPYSLSQSAAGSIFALYLVGSLSSGWIGSRADRAGHAATLLLCLVTMLAGVGATTLAPLWAIVIGFGLITVGFFGAHTVTSSWVGMRARQGKAQASALYLFFFYVGASVAGASGGWFWTAFGWTGVAAFLGALLLAALAIARWLGTRTIERRERQESTTAPPMQ